MPAELNILILNLVILLLAYFALYPRVAGGDVMKVAYYDLIATGTALMIVGMVFWGSERQFSLLLFDVNWFWFTLLTYLGIELPFMSWYFKKYNVLASIAPEMDEEEPEIVERKSHVILAPDLADYRGKELNVTVRVRFDDATSQLEIADVFDLVNTNSAVDHSGIGDPLEALKQRLSQYRHVPVLLANFKHFDRFVTSLEWLNTEAEQGTVMNFVTTDDGVAFAHELESLFLVLGATVIEISVDGVVGEA